MSNVIGDLFWNYILKPFQSFELDNALKQESAIRQSAQTSGVTSPDFYLEFYHVTDPQMKTEFRAAWEKLPPIKDNGIKTAEALIETIKGQAAKAQLEAVAGVRIDDTTPVSQRLFEQLGVVSSVGIAAATAEIAGAAIPTTNLQHAGIAVREFMNVNGLTQITGFGYGMLFSSVVSPLVTQELAQKVRTALPDTLTTITAFRRGALTEEQKMDIFARYGFPEEYTAAMEKASEFYPAAQDFVRFAVRDTFKADVVSKYQYDEGYPSDMDKYLTAAGVSSEWMHHFWRAHWQLPSPQMGYEMLHRGIISMEELTTLLKIDDFAPFWVPKLIEMSYNPLTRVDIRRLFKDGVISRDQVKREYLNGGYDEQRAEWLTVWTTKGVTSEKKEKVKDISEARIIQAYSYGEYDANETKTRLIALGYDAEETDLLITLADRKAVFDELDQEWKLLKAEYLAGLVNESGAVSRMNDLALPQKQQEKWLRQLARENRLVTAAAAKKAKTSTTTTK